LKLVTTFEKGAPGGFAAKAELKGHDAPVAGFTEELYLSVWPFGPVPYSKRKHVPGAAALLDSATAWPKGMPAEAFGATFVVALRQKVAIRPS
jgi:hypothetical protein